jgi:hypothetical protein
MKFYPTPENLHHRVAGKFVEIGFWEVVKTLGANDIFVFKKQLSTGSTNSRKYQRQEIII